MKQVERKETEEARRQLPELLEAAQQGQSTIITKHGRPVAVLIPVDEFVQKNTQHSLLPCEGSGRGLWGSNSTDTLRALRDEWER